MINQIIGTILVISSIVVGVMGLDDTFHSFKMSAFLLIGAMILAVSGILISMNADLKEIEGRFE